MKIYYITDPMCGWCFGFTPVMMKLQTEHAAQYEIEVVSGGMITGENVGPMREQKRKYISTAYHRVEELCGVKFGKAYINGALQNPATTENSETPTAALEVLREGRRQQSLEIFHAIQNTLFADGRDPSDVISYLDVAEKFGVDSLRFTQAMSDTVYHQRAQQQFELSSRWGITGFPAVVAQHGDSLYLVANGFIPYDELLLRLENMQGE